MSASWIYLRDIPARPDRSIWRGVKWALAIEAGAGVIGYALVKLFYVFCFLL